MIIHILKNGKVLKDIQGHVVAKEDAPCAYAIIEKLNKEKGGKENGRC